MIMITLQGLKHELHFFTLLALQLGVGRTMPFC